MVGLPVSPLGKVIPRRAAAAVTQALADTRVVLVNGARQCGKSTLVAQLTKERGAGWYSLDRAETLQAARRDPTGFVRAANPMLIDQVQREPSLLLAIKEVVDAAYEPGRFLLTGSARVLGLRNLPDALPGRMETIELWPLSQGEIDASPDGFIDSAFAQGPKLSHESALTRGDYAARLARGGFPAAVAREGKRRTRFLESYLADVLNRDVIQLSSIEHGHRMRSLATLLAGRDGQLLNVSGVGNALGLDRQTTARYISLLEEVFLLKRIPAWSNSATARAVRAPKLAFVDSGIACALLGQDESSLGAFTSDIGGILEAFAAMELARQATWCDQTVDLYHYRTQDQAEVDIVLQNRRQEIIGIEIKAAQSVSNADFGGLRHLQAKVGRRMLAGYVLYLGEQTLPFGEGLRALPLSAIWELG